MKNKINFLQSMEYQQKLVPIIISMWMSCQKVYKSPKYFYWPTYIRFHRPFSKYNS